MKDIDKEFKPFQFSFNGKWKPSYPSEALAEGDFQVLTNMRYTDAPGIKSIMGMSKINSTAVSFA